MARMDDWFDHLEAHKECGRKGKPRCREGARLYRLTLDEGGGTVFPLGRDIIIVINRHVVAENRKRGLNDPPVRVSVGRHGRPRYAHAVMIQGFSTVVYDQKNPLPCGARAWIQTKAPVDLIR